ncbi:MAG: hypothetical protein ACRCZE_04370 [Candidatus Altimarinota bacterium]
MANNHLSEYENQIKLLITQEEWQKAYQLCSEILRITPDNPKFIKLRDKIELAVKEINRKSIKTELKNLEPLLANHQYQEYLEKIGPLQAYIQDFPEIKSLILNATALLNKQFQQSKVDFLNKEIQESEQLVQQKKFPEAVLLLEQLDKAAKTDLRIKSLLLETKNKWIDSLIEENDALINSSKFEDIILFLLKTEKINPNYPKLKNLIQSVKKRYKDSKVENKKDFIFKTLEEVNVLIIKKKFDKAHELNRKILNIDPDNQTALQHRKFLLKKIHKLTEKELTQHIFDYYQTNKTLYQQSPESFLKI